MWKTHNFTSYIIATTFKNLIIIKKAEGLLSLLYGFFVDFHLMGNDTKPLLCEDIDTSKYYVAEVEIYAGGDPLTGCSRPYWRNYHDAISGTSLAWWVCNHKDCTDGIALFQTGGDAQRVVRVFGPYADMTEAQEHVW
jgi:hypothetical protein